MVAAPDVHGGLCGGVVAGYCGWIVVSKCTCWCCSAPA